jgi:hypothetical protein
MVLVSWSAFLFLEAPLFSDPLPEPVMTRQGDPIKPGVHPDRTLLASLLSGAVAWCHRWHPFLLNIAGIVWCRMDPIIVRQLAAPVNTSMVQYIHGSIRPWFNTHHGGISG